MNIFLAILFGLIIGSFLNVCIWRVPRREDHPLELSVLRPMRSICPKCGHNLSAWENIPLVSWFILGGKCHSCKASISSRYPLVEAMSGIAAAASYVYYGGITPTSVVVYAVTATLIVITFIDIDLRIIPDVISKPGIIIGFILSAVAQYTNYFIPPLSPYSGEPLYRHIITTGALDSLIGAFSGSGFFLAVLLIYFWITKREGLGMGDVKLMAFLGAVFGYNCIMPTIFLGSLCGSVFGIAVMIINKSGRGTEIAFGPWLALGAVLYLFTEISIFNF